MSRCARRLVATLALAVGAGAVAHADAIYKCNVGGHVVFQSAPCPPGSGGPVDLKPVSMMDGSKPGVADAVKGPYDSTLWYSDYAGYTTALRESERTGAPLLVLFYTDWCPYCKKFRANVLPDTAVAQRLRHFVKVRVNTEIGAQETKFFQNSGGRGIPYVTVRPAHGTAAQIGAAQDPREFAQILDAHLLPSH